MAAKIESETKKNPKTVQMTATCRFCQQSRIIEGNEGMTDAELEEQVTLACSCESAKWYRARLERTKSAKEHIDRLFGAKASGYKQPDAVLAIMKFAIDQIDCEEIKNVTINLNNGLKCKIALTTDDKIKVSREAKSVVEYKK